MSGLFEITGQVALPDGKPAPNVTLRAFDKSLPSLDARGLGERRLGGDALTDADGRYRIAFGEQDFQQGATRGRAKARPDIVVRAFDGDTLLVESGVHHDAGQAARIDLTIALPHRSEYESLLREITPILQGVAVADLTDEDVAFLKGEAGIGETRTNFIGRLLREPKHQAGTPIDLLGALRTSARIVREAGVVPQACYAWARLLAPSDLAQLQARSDAELRAALGRGIAQDLVPASLQERIEASIHALRRHAYVSHRATGRLVDPVSGQVVSRPGFKVRIFDVTEASSPVDLGVAVADRDGVFGVAYAGPATGPGPVRFRLGITDPEGQALGDHVVAIAPGQSHVFDAPVLSRATGIAQAMSAALSARPPELVAFLHERGLRTLADVRRAGGLSRLAGLPLPADHAVVVALQAHADLDRISDDVTLNQALIERGYPSVTAIADAPRAGFVSAMQAEAGAVGATRLHAMASAQAAVLDNLLAGAAAAQANGFAQGVVAADGSMLFADSCACEDCESAVSPAIYLADLVGYTAKSVVSGASPADLPFLTNALHQPFGDLTSSCEGVTRMVSRTRIGVEVLRAYLGVRPLAAAPGELGLEKVEAAHLASAYMSLLTQIGVSYEELRLARTAPDEKRRALADRLGIDLTVPRPAAPGDELDRLLLDLSIEVGTPGSLAALRTLERNIEGLFGFAGTSRDPLSDGAKFGDEGDDMTTRWQFRGAEWGRNTDPDGFVYASLVKPSPVETATMAVYRDAQRQRLVASTIGGEQLMPRNESGLSGVLALGNGAVAVTDCSIGIVPNVLSWRLRRLRAQWTQEDHPADAYADAAVPQLPVIDPDVIGVDDFRAPFQKFRASVPDQPFDLWLRRRAAIDQILADLQQAREGSPDGLTLILGTVFGTPPPDIGALLRALTQGDASAIADAVATIEAMQLTVDSFTRLATLRAKDADATAGPGVPLTEGEWREVYAILAQVRKLRLAVAWRAEERALGTPLILGLRDFWFSLREPVVGDWPVVATPGVPLIDPDLVSLKDLPEGTAGSAAIQLWNARKTRLAQTLPQELSDMRASQGFDAMVALALGTPPGTPLPPQDDLDLLAAKLASSNPADVTAAQDAIANDLRLTLDGFATLVAVRAKDKQPESAGKPTAAAYAGVVALLTQARKLKTEYPQWIIEEAGAFDSEARAVGEPAASTAYWRARKSALPIWRASVEARQAWRGSLQAACARPIVDPDLVDDFDLRDPVAGNAAYDLWQARSADLAARMSAITSGPASTIAFDQLLGNPDYFGFGFNHFALEELDLARAAGSGIQGRLDQLGLGYAAFDVLLRVSRLLDSGQAILPSEWADVAAILVQAYKRKQFATWRLEERPAVALGPDLFQRRPPILDPFDGPTAPAPALPAWRATAADRRTWDDTLQARIDQQDATIAAMRDAVVAAEAASLVSLRDGLIQATDAPGTASDLAAKAEWLTQKLLIDLQAGNCQTTTRVEQAVESLQTLLSAARTALGAEQLPGLALAVAAADFDQKWQWLGSYATWRSAMLVFLYPETLLAPTLRPRQWQTPGFRNLVATLSDAGNPSPLDACRAVGQYSSYLRDISVLVVEATCHAMLPILQRDDCGGYSFDGVEHYAFFMFARSPSSGKCYWSVHDLEVGAQAGGADFAQSPWKELVHPTFADAIKLVGAVPFKGICLFAHTRHSNTEDLVAFRLDIFTEEVTLAAENLKPSGIDTFTAAVMQDPGVSAGQQTFNVTPPPTLGVQAPDGSLYLGQLNGDGNAWAPRYPRIVNTYTRPILALAEHGNVANKIVVVPLTEPSDLGASDPDWEVSFLPGVLENGVTDGAYHGLVWLSDQQTPGFTDRSGLTFFVIGDFGSSAAVFTLYESQNSTVNGMVSQVDAIVPAGGPGWVIPGVAGVRYQFVFKRRPDGAFRRCAFDFIDDEFIRNMLYLQTDSAVIPAIPYDLTGLPHDLTSEALQLRKQKIAQAFADNVGAPESVRTYLEEAFFFVPMLAGLALEQSGEYESALEWFRTVYDYTAPRPDDRRIYYGLVLEAQQGPDDYRWSTTWLDDSLNPHAIAKTRRNSYTKYTIFSIVRCLLGFADSQFSQDTNESLVRARVLYEKALELLATDVLVQTLPDCTTIFSSPVGPPSIATLSIPVRDGLARTLAQIANPAKRQAAAAQVAELLQGAQAPARAIAAARQAARDAALDSTKALSLAARLDDATRKRRESHASLLATSAGEQLSVHAGRVASLRLAGDLARDGNTPSGSEPVVSPGPIAASFATGEVPSSIPLWGCIPRHPLLRTLRLHADVNLQKLRSGRNIAGMKRVLDPYAAPTDAASALPSIGASGQLNLAGAVAVLPTLYRYSVLIERVKQLVQLSGQIEASMLAALTQLDIESYNLLKAQQDFRLAQAGVQLQQVRIRQAGDGVTLAQDQQTRAQIQFQGYTDILANTEVQQYEQEALKQMRSAADRLDTAATMAVVSGVFNTIMATASGAAQGAALGPAGAILGGILSGAGSGVGVDVAFQQITAQKESIQASVNSMLASIEQRREDISLQRALASQDIDIGGQQIQIAQDNVAIANQELTIAGIQSDNASDGIHFLATKFTGVDLYNWMSGVLQSVYRFFLQQATSMAKTAENQLAFERQDLPTAFIQSDYWAVSAGGAALPAGGQSTDRKGLTGSARLLEDVYRLDQYAFDTLKRKLQLSKTFSLASLAPADFQRFRESGSLVFATPSELFDRDFPGHYLRLIKRVRTSVVALIPPIQGIHATLVSGGVSRVVIGGDLFQAISIRRDPDYVAYCSAVNASGQFELEQQSDMLFPFEGSGVDMTWEFAMPKAANFFDFGSIADVLVTIDYTALNSFDFRQQVIQAQPASLSADAPFGFRSQFSDPWYELLNPDQSDTPMTVRFTTSRQDLPPNLDDLRIQQVLLYFSRADGKTFEIPVASLRFTEQGSTGAVGGAAVTIDGTVSTRRGNAASWLPIVGKGVAGDWELALADSPQLRGYFADQLIEDILFVITYSGARAGWRP